jgi:hypothetical protein
MNIEIEGFYARHAAQAADGLLDKSAKDPAAPAALALAMAGMGQAVLSLAIGVNRLADTTDHFTGGPGPRPGIDEVTAAIDRLGNAIDRLGS